MAEVIGVASSVSGLMTLADIVVRRGYKFIKDVREADETVRKIVDEVNNLSGVLHSLSNVVERLEEEDSRHDPSTQIHYIESCYQTLAKLRDLFDGAMPEAPLSKSEKLRWPLKKSHTKELLVEIERHKATMTLAMSAREMSTLLVLLARQENIQDGLRDLKTGLDLDRAERKRVVIDKERQMMLDFLGKVDPRKWQESNIRLRQPGTGVWFTDGTEFKDWFSTERSKLWIHGIAGAGKTILISSIIQDIQKSLSPSSALAFFYCDYKNTQTHDPLAILGALARQLILQNEACFAELEEFYRTLLTTDHSSRVVLTLADLCKLIAKVSTHFATTMIVVDGLDEITENRSGVTRTLQSLNSPDGSIKTLFSSRIEVDIGYELETFEQVSIAAKSSDLRLYIASELEKRMREKRLRIRDSSLKEHIMKRLEEGAEGMFRWVACQMDYLCECSTDRDRRAALQKLPPDLPSSYERILERVNRSTKENQILVKNTLHWIVYATLPMTTKRLLQALAVHDDDTSFDESAMTTEEEILHWCSSLVRKNPSNSWLEIAHFTVKEFLFAIDPLGNPRFLQYRLSGDHSVVAKSCINFLKCENLFNLSTLELEFQEANSEESGKSDYEGEVDEDDAYNARLNPFWNSWICFMNEYDFIEYAGLMWNYHVHKSDWEAVQQRVLDLFIPSFNKISLWTLSSVWLANSTGHTFKEHMLLKEPGRPRALHWAAGCALDKLCEILIKKGAEVNQASSFGTPLYCAIAWPGVSSLTPVLELDTLPSTGVLLVLGEAFTIYRESTVRLLVNAGADVHTQIAAENPNRCLDVALALEREKLIPTVTTILLDAGAKLSTVSFSVLLRNLESVTVTDGRWEQDAKSDRIFELIKRVLAGYGACLEQDAHASFFAYILAVICSGCPISAELLSCFESSCSFWKTLSTEVTKEFNGLLNTGKGSGSLRRDLVGFLSKAIRTASRDPQDALLHLQKSFLQATARWQDWAVASLLELNADLDSSSDLIDSALLNALDNLDLEELNPDASPYNRCMFTIKILVKHGANVLLKSEMGIMAIEKAAECGVAATFQLFWESAKRTESADSMHKLGETLLSKATTPENDEVSEFLQEELARRN